jgi:hypothetical protein
MSLPMRARAYLWLVVSLAAGVLGWLWVRLWLPSAPPPPGVAGVLAGRTPGELAVLGELVAFAVVAQHFPLAFGPKRSFDLSIAWHYALLLLAPPPVAMTLTALGEGAGQATLMVRQDRETGKRLRGPYGQSRSGAPGAAGAWRRRPAC